MTPDLTVIYYTADYEKPELLVRVRQTLWTNKGDCPLISVSQSPLDFGQNICVGGQVTSTQNTYRQFQLGAMQAATKWVCTAEDDCLYPPEYFQYDPEDEDHMHCAVPMYALYARTKVTPCFIPKRYGSFGASFMSRTAAIEAVEKCLAGLGQWGDKDEQELPKLSQWLPQKYATFTNPIVSIKTDEALHRRTPIYPGVCQEVPYWGTVEEVTRRYVA